MSVMTFPTATTTLADQVRPSQLERVVRFDESAQWLPSVLSDLRSLEASCENVPGVGDFKVASSTADNVRRLLIAISGTPLPEPKLAPFSGGGIALICSMGNSELMFTAYPGHHDFVFSQTNEADELTEQGTVTLEQPRLGNVITAFLAR